MHTHDPSLPSEVVLDPRDDPIGRRCAVNLDSIDSVSTAVLVERIGALSGLRMRDSNERHHGR